MRRQEWPTEDDEMRRLGYGSHASARPRPSRRRKAAGLALLMGAAFLTITFALDLACRAGAHSLCGW